MKKLFIIILLPAFMFAFNLTCVNNNNVFKFNNLNFDYVNTDFCYKKVCYKVLEKDNGENKICYIN